MVFSLIVIYFTDNSIKYKKHDTSHHELIRENVQLLKSVLRRVASNQNASDISILRQRLDDIILPSSMTAPILTIFTTFKGTPDRFQIQLNCLKNWAILKPFVRPVLFDINTNETLLRFAEELGWNILPISSPLFYTPQIKELYTLAVAKFESTFYGFSNGDVLYDYGLIDTLIAVKHCLTQLNRTLIVGQRTNFKSDGQELFSPFDIQLVAKQNGKLFQEDAEDYFFIAHNDFIWNQIPSNLVIGRPGYDNFLVAAALHSGINVVDASETLLALHQTGSDGNYAGHLHGDRDINIHRIGDFTYADGHKFRYADGLVSKAQYKTVLNDHNEIEIWHRITKADPRSFKVGKHYS